MIDKERPGRGYRHLLTKKDILEFIDCKANEEKKAYALGKAGWDMSLNGEAWASIQFQNANNSVRATDEFMQAVVDDLDWDLHAIATGASDADPPHHRGRRRLER